MCMERKTERSVAQNDETSQETIVNYMPAMPRQSDQPSRVGRILRKVFRRRGALRPVTREEEPVVTTYADD
jgi:hypothetical protein